MSKVNEKDVEMAKADKGTGLTNRGRFFPYFFSLTPRDFFTLNPFEMMKRFTEEMSPLFGEFEFYREPFTFKPAIEIFERGKDYIVRAELPGIEKENVKVELVENALVIKGERKSERKEEEKGCYRSEISYGNFYRTIPLPEGVVLENTSATFNNGVLEVTIPIPEALNKRREIPIEQATVKAQTATKS
ncbi:MAG: Hsp20/alpha crystallin family protein [Acidobacteriota bacterium]